MEKVGFSEGSLRRKEDHATSKVRRIGGVGCFVDEDLAQQACG